MIVIPGRVQTWLRILKSLDFVEGRSTYEGSNNMLELVARGDCGDRVSGGSKRIREIRQTN